MVDGGTQTSAYPAARFHKRSFRLRWRWKDSKINHQRNDDPLYRRTQRSDQRSRHQVLFCRRAENCHAKEWHTQLYAL